MEVPQRHGHHAPRAMQRTLLPYVVFPAVVLGIVTVLRAWMEVRSPDATVTRLLSASVLSLLWVLCVPALLLKRGHSLLHGLLLGLLFFLLHRPVIGAVYAMAWAGRWTVAGGSDPVRYVAQTQAATPDASPMEVFVRATLPPVPFGLALLFAVWAITWAIAFRGKRPFAAAAPAGGR
jgi:hypothetical protein